MKISRGGLNGFLQYNQRIDGILDLLS